MAAVLPTKLDRPGKVLGDLLLSHFSFYTQEHRLLQTDILEDYYRLAGLSAPARDKPKDKVRLKDRIRFWRKRRQRGPKGPDYQIVLRGT